MKVRIGIRGECAHSRIQAAELGDFVLHNLHDAIRQLTMRSSLCVRLYHWKEGKEATKHYSDAIAANTYKAATEPAGKVQKHET